MEYLLHILILIGIYVILATSLNLIAGCTGLVSIVHAAFYGVGAYTVALMALKLQSPAWLSVPCGVACAGLLGAAISIPSLRLRDDYFVIATFAFQILAFSVLNNWSTTTGGPLGLAGIPQPVVFGLTVSSTTGFLVIVTVFCSAVVWTANHLIHSPFGRVLKAIREDEALPLTYGKNVAAFKVSVFVVGAGMSALAGAVYAYYISYIDPTSFTAMESIFIISIVIIGGAGTVWGPISGAIALVSLPEILRLVGLPSSVAANIRQIAYGALLVVFMVWRPQGLLGDYSFEKANSRK